MPLDTLQRLKDHIRAEHQEDPRYPWRVSQNTGDIYYSDRNLLVFLNFHPKVREFRVSRWEYKDISSDALDRANLSRIVDGLKASDILTPDQVCNMLMSLWYDVEETQDNPKEAQVAVSVDVEKLGQRIRWIARLERAGHKVPRKIKKGIYHVCAR